jgi:hypothetical protein
MERPAGAERNQRALGPGHPAQERADREDRQACHEDAPATEDVGQPPAQEQHPAEQDRVRADHPLEVGLGEVQIAFDRGQRDIHDGDIQHNHELRRHDRRQGQPLAPGRTLCDR